MVRDVENKVRLARLRKNRSDRKAGALALICAALALVTFALYWRVQWNDFINYDDNVYIAENLHVLRGINGPDVKWAFTTGYTGYPHPVTWLSHQLDYQLYGPWAGGHHLTSVAVHTVNVLLLFLFLWRTTRGIWQSAFVAAIFAVHPLHVESVAWIAERKDVLCSLFFLLTLHAYASYAEKRSRGQYVLALVFFALGLLSKPMIVTLPLILLLLDYWPLGRMPLGATKHNWGVSGAVRGLIWEKIPFVLLAVVWSLITFFIQKESGDVAGIAKIGIITRVANAVVSYATYLWETFWPHNLAVFYPYLQQLPWPVVVGAAALLAFISVVAVAGRRSFPYFIVGWLWFLGMLMPVIGVIQAGAQARADRYTYLPQIGLIVAFSWAISDLSKSWLYRRSLFVAAAAIALTLLAARAWRQAAVWHDSESLWRHALAVTNNNDTAHTQLCDALVRKGRIDEAISQAEMALQIRPNSPEAHSNLAIALSQKGEIDLALLHFQRVLEIKPDRPKLHYNMATVLAEKGQLDAAILHYERELQIQPAFAEAHNNLGTALMGKGELDDALVHFQKALRVNPRLPKVHYNAAVVLLRKGERDEAIEHLQKELQINPASTEAHNKLGLAWSQEGRIDLAIGEWQKTLELQPNDLNAHFYLAWIFATFPDDTIRNGTKAISLAERALHLSGERDPRIYRLLAAAYAENGQFDEAIQTAQRGSHLAIEQENYALADRLESNIDLYRKSVPLRDTGE